MVVEETLTVTSSPTFPIEEEEEEEDNRQCEWWPCQIDHSVFFRILAINQLLFTIMDNDHVIKPKRYLCTTRDNWILYLQCKISLEI